VQSYSVKFGYVLITSQYIFDDTKHCLVARARSSLVGFCVVCSACDGYRCKKQVLGQSINLLRNDIFCCEFKKNKELVPGLCEHIRRSSRVSARSLNLLFPFYPLPFFFPRILIHDLPRRNATQVEDWRDYSNRGEQEQHQKEDREPYEVERIATVLAVTCMFLAGLYTIFAILLFLYYGSEDPSRSLDDDMVDDSAAIVGGPMRHHRALKSTSHGLTSIGAVHHPATVVDPRRENFITMGEST